MECKSEAEIKEAMRKIGFRPASSVSLEALKNGVMLCNVKMYDHYKSMCVWLGLTVFLGAIILISLGSYLNVPASAPAMVVCWTILCVLQLVVIFYIVKLVSILLSLDTMWTTPITDQERIPDMQAMVREILSPENVASIRVDRGTLFGYCKLVLFLVTVTERSGRQWIAIGVRDPGTF